MTGMQGAVLGEAIQGAIGERMVTALVFCTHDLEPPFFEIEILPVFLGNDLKHNQRTRWLQLDHEMRDRGVAVDVYFEGRALVEYEGAARLNWNRLQMNGRGSGKFHPKVVLALCEQDGLESLVVAVSSANLTRGGWWTNLECADVVTITDGERHGYLAGLVDLVAQLQRSAPKLAERGATTAVRAFLARQRPYTNTTQDGVLRPTLLPGWSDLPGELARLFGRRIDGLHLEVISPFHDAVPLAPGAALVGLLDAFRPKSTTLALPFVGSGTPVAEAVYAAVNADDRVSWAKLPSKHARTADGVDAGDRSLHAKVYRFWRGGPDPLEVVVMGSHNLSAAAHSGTVNFEVSVVNEVRGRRQRALLEPLDATPDAFDVLDGDAEENEHLPSAFPLSLAYDWETRRAEARWESGSKPQPVTIQRAGETLLRVELSAPKTTIALGTDESIRLGDLLRVSCVVTAVTDDKRSRPLLVIERNHDLKPALIEGLELNPAEILALWSIPDLRERLRRLGRARAAAASNEDDLEHSASTPAPPASMFEQFAGVLHAFASLRKRVDSAVAEGRLRQAGILVYSEGMDSPTTALALVREQAENDPALAYVTFRCATLLTAYVARAHPAVAEQFVDSGERLDAVLAHTEELRAALIASGPEAERAELGAFVAWFDRHFDEELSA